MALAAVESQRHLKSLFPFPLPAFRRCRGNTPDDLAERLRRGIYEPETSTKLFHPKASGILRPYSLLSVEDQIVYQAALNLIAEKLYPRVVQRYNKHVFGHLYAGKTSTWFYRKWSDGYKAFNNATKQAFADGYIYTASFDLTACYDSLDHRVLNHFLGKLGFDPDFRTKLTEWLEKWMATECRIFHNHGIPQGPLSSGLLSEVVTALLRRSETEEDRLPFLPLCG